MANSIFQMFNYPNLFATRFNHKLPHYVSPVLDNQAFAIDAFSMNWNNLHVYAFPPTMLISAVLNYQPVSVQNSSYSPSLAATNMVLRGSTTTCLSSSLSSTFSKTINTKKKFQQQNLPALNFHAWELSSNQLENFHKTLQILSPNQDEHQLRKSMM